MYRLPGTLSNMLTLQKVYIKIYIFCFLDLCYMNTKHINFVKANLSENDCIVQLVTVHVCGFFY